MAPFVFFGILPLIKDWYVSSERTPWQEMSFQNDFAFCVFMVKDLEYSELFWNATEITLQLILRIFLWFDFMWIIMSVNVEHFVSENWCDCSIVVLNRVCSFVLLKMLLILKELFYARCFMLFYLKMYFGIFVFFSCDGKAEFSVASLQCHAILRKSF